MEPLEIVTEPAEVLHRTARAVEPGELDLEQLVERMKPAMKGADGVGLAAPQVGKSIRLFIARLGKGEQRRVRAFVNPKIVSQSGEKYIDEEGCLSLPGMFGMIERPDSVTVEYRDLEFEQHSETFEGHEARVVQHEIDHLNGILISDRALGEGLYEGRRKDDSGAA